MASNLAHQSLIGQQNENRILTDRKKQIQKEINQAKLSLKGLCNANLGKRKSQRQKNPQIPQLEEKLSKLNADMKKVEQAISIRGSTTNSAEVEHAPQDSTDDIGTSQDVSYSVPEETHQSESQNPETKEENNVTKPLCRNCKGRFVTMQKLNVRYAEREKDNKRAMERSVEINKNLEIINEKQEALIQEKQQQIETSVEINKNLEIVNGRSAEYIKNLEVI